ncbi:MAG: DUF1517 domain-containing protein [Sandaracinaceae bacterium]|nr:DUF1517 domain-containing protein [Sandaracinaceae bacterium]
MRSLPLASSLLTGLVALLLVALAPSAVGAQTGGSFGSSDFGSSGSSGGGGGWSSSDWGSSGSSSSESGGSSAPALPPSAATFQVPRASLGTAVVGEIERASDEEWAARNASGDRSFWLFCGLCPLSFLGLFGVAWATGTTEADRRARAVASRRRGPCELRRVSIAFDWSVRARLQAALDRMANELPLEGAAGRRAALGVVARELDAALDGARYAAFQSLRLERATLEDAFRRAALDLRARYTQETAGARAHGPAPELAARREAGEGLVVVSVLCAAGGHFMDFPTTLDRAALANAVATLADADPPTLFALEVIWSPSVEQDRMSSLELEARYPELLPLDDVPRLGRVACDYCRAPYPAELARCPACGAPRA